MPNTHEIEISPESYLEELRSDTDFPYEAILSMVGKRGEYLSKWISLKTAAKRKAGEIETEMKREYPKLFLKYMTDYEIALTAQQADKMLKCDEWWLEKEKKAEDAKTCSEIADRAIKFFESLSYDARIVMESEKLFAGGI